MSTLLLFIGGSGSNWNCDLVNWLTFSFPFWSLARLKSLGMPRDPPNNIKQIVGFALIL